jgi:hypothetical protein
MATLYNVTCRSSCDVSAPLYEQSKSVNPSSQSRTVTQVLDDLVQPGAVTCVQGRTLTVAYQRLGIKFPSWEKHGDGVGRRRLRIRSLTLVLWPIGRSGLSFIGRR